MRRLLLTLLLFPAAAQSGGGVQDGRFVNIPAGQYKSVLRYEESDGKRQVPAFSLMKRPVTNAEFLAFVRATPEWRRDRVPSAFA